ncbi:MAG: hypothetical protein IPK16_32080 [Anaerolineales bacterium]|nr:hypothetical protein [Anaerolineales bacterium]
MLQSEQITGALSSYANLSQTIDGAMNQQTLGDAAIAIQTGANTIVAALDEARTGLACGQ